MLATSLEVEEVQTKSFKTLFITLSASFLGDSSHNALLSQSFIPSLLPTVLYALQLL